MKKEKSKYAYGWVTYRAMKPSDIIGLDGKPRHETIKMYNASAQDPEVSIKIKGKQYSFVTKDPEPDKEPDLKPGTRFLVPITKDEIDEVIKSGLDANKSSSRAEKRRWEKQYRKSLKGKLIVKIVDSVPNTDGDD